MFCNQRHVQLHSRSPSTCGQKVSAALKGRSLAVIWAASTTPRAAPTSAHWPTVLQVTRYQHGPKRVSARPLAYGPHYICSKLTRSQDSSYSSSKTSLSVSAPTFNMLPTAEGKILLHCRSATRNIKPSRSANTSS